MPESPLAIHLSVFFFLLVSRKALTLEVKLQFFLSEYFMFSWPNAPHILIYIHMFIHREFTLTVFTPKFDKVDYGF